MGKVECSLKPQQRHLTMFVLFTIYKKLSGQHTQAPSKEFILVVWLFAVGAVFEVAHHGKASTVSGYSVHA